MSSSHSSYVMELGFLKPMKMRCSPVLSLLFLPPSSLPFPTPTKLVQVCTPDLLCSKHCLSPRNVWCSRRLTAWGCFARNPGKVRAKTGQRPNEAEDGEQTLSVEEVSLRREVNGADQLRSRGGDTSCWYVLTCLPSSRSVLEHSPG